jgi:superfamily II DNA or RNA helicase
MTLTPRPYQSDDLSATLAVLDASGSALGVAATGLGKAVLIALLAKEYVERGKRVLVLADMGILVDQLAETIEDWAGIRPGIERASSSASEGFFGRGDPIVVGTVQTQFAKRGDGMRCHKWESGEFGLVVGDEAEAFMAPQYRAVLAHHCEAGGHLFGCTATPLRGDGQALGDIFKSVAFNRDIRWGVANGYLVPPRQGRVDVELDFGKLRAVGGDYTDASVHALLRNLDERRGLEFARGIVELSGQHRGIVVAPHIDSAVAIMDYINAVRPGMAKCVYGTMSDADKRDTMFAFKHGHFQVLCSVNMLTKGFDDAGIHNVFMCRPTRSKRLYTQVLGRGTRMADPAIGALATVDERLAAIASSSKPRMTMFNMVGIDADVRDLNIADVLGGDMTDRQAAAARLAVAASPDSDPVEVIEAEKDRVARLDADAEAKRRAEIDAKAKVRVMFSDALKATNEPEFRRRRANPDGTLPASASRTLRRFRIPAWIIARLTPTEANFMASDCIRRKKGGWCSINQAAALQREGIDPTYVKASEASRILGERLPKE